LAILASFALEGVKCGGTAWFSAIEADHGVNGGPESNKINIANVSTHVETCMAAYIEGQDEPLSAVLGLVRFRRRHGHEKGVGLTLATEDVSMLSASLKMESPRKNLVVKITYQ
jgi:hypothetical protein